MYVLSGGVKFYVNHEVFVVTPGECMFLPRGVPHAFLIESEEIDVITLISPGGFFEAVNKMNMPAKRMGLPDEGETPTYATADLTETIKVFEQYGIRFLTSAEIRSDMPQYRFDAFRRGSRKAGGVTKLPVRVVC